MCDIYCTKCMEYMEPHTQLRRTITIGGVVVDSNLYIIYNWTNNGHCVAAVRCGQLDRELIYADCGEWICNQGAYIN